MPGIEDSVREICQALDQAIRQRQGRRVEDYLSALEANALSTELWLELIYTEYVARCECGEQPKPEEYFHRFPQFAQDLEELFFLHQVVKESLDEAGLRETDGRAPALETSSLQSDVSELTGAAELASESPSREELDAGTSATISPNHEATSSASRIPEDTDREDRAFPTILGHYELLEEIGRGATAIVYKARDLRLKRYVALKVVNQAAWDKTARQRFLAEVEAAAALRHPHIVQIYEIGESAESWFVAMEYLEGGSLADRPDKVWSPREAAKMVATLARAVQYAHEHHILHRDLKPANVLLDADGSPKIADFGLAKRLDERSLMTTEEELIGTPAYMAPEQTSSEVGRIGPTTDVYALGAILYELLTGRPPFHGRNVIETLLQVRHQDPVPPNRLQPSVHRDLVTICLKCLEKDPSRRYPSAAALADDLHRFLEGQVIWARPAGPVERALKWLRRHATVAVSLAAVMASVAIAIVGLRWYASEMERIEADRRALSHLAEQQAQELRSQEDASRHQRYVDSLFRAEELLLENAAQALAILEDPDRCPPDLRDFAWNLLHNLCLEGRTSWSVASTEDKWIRRLVMSPDGRFLLWGTWDGSILLWDTQAHIVKETFPAHSDWIAAMAFAPAGNVFATSSYDHTIHVWQWTPSEDPPVRLIRAFRLTADDVCWDLAFHPQGEFLLAATDSGVGVFKIAQGNDNVVTTGETMTSDLPGAARPAHTNKVNFLTPDVLRALGSGDGAFFTIPPINSGLPHPILVRDSARFSAGMFRSVAIAPNGHLIACGSANGRVALVSWPDLQLVHQVREFQEPVWSLDFSPDSNLLAGAAGGSIWLYNLTTRQARYLRDVHFHPIRTVRFSPDGRYLLTAAEDYTARVWDVRNLSQSHRLSAHVGYAVYGAFSPDSRLVYTASQGVLNVWDLEKQEVPPRLETENRIVRAVAVSPDGTRIATVEGLAFRDSTISLWDTATRTRLVSAKQAGLSDDWLFFTADGQWIVAVVRERQLQIRDARRLSSPRTVSSLTVPLTALTLSPNGKLVLGTDRRGRFIAWDTKSWLETDLQGLALSGNYATSLAFSPDGHYLVAGTANGQIVVWDFDRRRQVATAFLQNGPVATIAFSPTTSQIAVVSRLIPAIQRFEFPSLRFLGSWEETPGFITYLAYSPDGQALLSATPPDAAAGKVELRIWNVATGRCHASFSDFGGPLLFVPYSQQFLSLDRTRQVRIWPFAKSGVQSEKSLVHPNTETPVENAAITPASQFSSD
ncbi:protein kinase domain-containing protein [Thermogutta sp.]|uniref:protein kinase domain-containing protein n=1 Tax=Thermogutta sp. TaxID=1962930 RepID=UPI003C7A9838